MYKTHLKLLNKNPSTCIQIQTFLYSIREDSENICEVKERQSELKICATLAQNKDLEPPLNSF